MLVTLIALFELYRNWALVLEAAGARGLLPFPLALRTQIPRPVRSFSSPLPAHSCLHDAFVL